MPLSSSNLTDLRLAVLIDAENVPHNCIKSVMKEITIYGTPTIKRIYGDWTNPVVSGWKQDLLENAITPIQQYSYTSGKNVKGIAKYVDVYRYCPNCGKRGRLYNGYHVYDEETDKWL